MTTRKDILETSCNTKSTGFLVRCAACGLFLTDATPDFEVIAVTQLPERALAFPDGTAAAKARDMMRALYPSFDWRAVEREIQLEQQKAVYLYTGKGTVAGYVAKYNAKAA